jgi:hypothetical protein
LHPAKETKMGRDRQHIQRGDLPTEDLPSDDGEKEREARKSRDRLDDIPPPGTDPLHEGP